MTKIDYKKELKHLYNPSKKEVALVDVPPMNFLLVDGSGYPGTSQAYEDAMEALYAMAYTLKFKIKKSDGGVDFTVMPLEGLWWAEDMELFAEEPDNWLWTSMIMQPEHVTEMHVAQAQEEVERKKNPVALPLLRFERFHEGLSAQIMHIGPFSEEGPTIEKLHAFIAESGHTRRDKHHEIYLSDPRRTAPEKLRTIIRQPVSEA